MTSAEGADPRAAHLELAEILRAHPPCGLTRDQGRVVADLTACRTAALGGHLQRCDLCGREHPLYNSCRNRHCPKCQGLEQALWVETQARDLLPVPYFHQVFTTPPALHPFFRRDPPLAYRLLFAAVAQTLLDVARSQMGATPGFIALLHTWTQTMLFHPHVHCIATGGGLSLDRQRWIASRPRFFLPVRVLSDVFRGKLLSSIERALDQGHFHVNPTVGRTLLRQATATPWVVYSKPPLAGPEQVLRYLGRYTHRIAISNGRLLALQDGKVTFRFKDRAHGGRPTKTSLPADTFLRRFLQHVLPRHFVRVRHYGLLANPIRLKSLRLARSLLLVPSPPEPATQPTESRLDLFRRLTGTDPNICPHCGRGRLHFVAQLQPTLAPPHVRSP